MICDCGEFINEQSGLCPKCHAEVIKQLAQQKALLDKYKKALDVAMKYINAYIDIDNNAFEIKKEINQILGKEEGDR